MKRLLAAALLLLGIVCLAQAQLTTSNVGEGGFGGGAGYQGPGTIQSGWIAFYSCRAFNAAAIGTKAYRVIRASDSTQADVNSLGTGACDPAPAFCNATTCKVVTYYDQSGANACGGTACDATQATDANRPDLKISEWNGLPCSQAATNRGLAVVNNLTQNLPLTLVAVAATNGAPGTFGCIMCGGGSGLYAHTTATITALYSGSAGDVTITATIHGYVGVIPAAGNSTLYVDGTSNSVTSGNTNWSASVISLYYQGANPQNGDFCEGGVIGAGLNSTQAGALNTNMHGTWNN